MNKKIYKKIAREFGVTIEEVRREMEAAIDAAYQEPTFYARCVKFKGDKPTPDEFFDHIIHYVQNY